MLDMTPILTAVRQAATLTRRVQAEYLERSDKAGREPVTIADYGSQAILLRAISQIFPDDAVLAEEQGQQFMTLVGDEQRATVVQLVGEALGESVSEAELVNWLDHGRGLAADRTWAIDPIDGTKGFLARRRYSIAAALLIDGQPVAGILGSPGYPTGDGAGLLFYAQGSAAYVEPMGGGKAYRIAISGRSQPRDLKVVESVERDHAHLEKMAQVYAQAGIKQTNVEGVDSQDKYAMIACGDADLYLRLPREANPQHRIWDHAPGTALIQAAGGVVTDIDGSPLNFASGMIMVGTQGMVVSNGHAHDQIIDTIQAVLKGT
ncbi:MAG: 3'(2'),5'-bisphosphate nucleotidase [Chloroflexi bacterium]|nr:3'(2'),5'-bisphosphate nucleotidase [Chloroflexota bacterium]